VGQVGGMKLNGRIVIEIIVKILVASGHGGDSHTRENTFAAVIHYAAFNQITPGRSNNAAVAAEVFQVLQVGEHQIRQGADPGLDNIAILHQPRHMAGNNLVGFISLGF